MNVDEILANAAAAANLPDGAIPTHVVLLVEFVDPSDEHRPGAPRLAVRSDDDCAPWTALGMMRFACELEYDAVRDDDD